MSIDTPRYRLSGGLSDQSRARLRSSAWSGAVRNSADLAIMWVHDRRAGCV